MTVATDHRLQDATACPAWDFLIDPLGNIPTSTGERLRYYLKVVDPTDLHAEFLWAIKPAWGQVIEVDGIEYRSQMMSGNSSYFFNCRPDHISHDHQTNAEGFCDCQPYEYHPLSYRAGEICERCWLGEIGDPRSGGEVRGIGKSGCDHGKPQLNRK